MLGAVLFVHKEMQTAIDASNKLAAEPGKLRWE
jgi:polyribonucleotide nucleotidyltransferase